MLDSKTNEVGEFSTFSIILILKYLLPNILHIFHLCHVRYDITNNKAINDVLVNISLPCHLFLEWAIADTKVWVNEMLIIFTNTVT